MLDPQSISLALAGGILPALLWLWFWLKEDAKNPEPRKLIALTFVAGMLAVVVVFPLEKIAFSLLPEGPRLLLVWAAIEEVAKFLAFAFVAFKSRFFDEPVDAMIYAITAALGFAALENSLFLLSPFLDGEIASGLLTGNLRYLGATLLHVAAAGILGAFIGWAFYKNFFIRFFSIIAGLIAATALHTLFNFSIMYNNGTHTFFVFFVLWIIIVILIFLFDRIKRVGRP